MHGFPRAVAAVVALLTLSAPARADRWIASWTGSAQGPYPAGNATAQPELGFAFPSPERGARDQTFRLIVRPDVWGGQTRIRLSNVFGTRPVTFDDVFVGLQQIGAVIVEGTNAAVQFGGKTSVTIPVGESVVSDPVTLGFVGPSAAALLRGRKLAVSFHVAGESGPMTWHAKALTTSYLTAPGDGSKSADIAETAFPFSTTSWYFLDEVDMRVADRTRLIVAFGDSITDGTATTINGDDRWPDVLSRRLHARFGDDYVVVNEGIGGNQVAGPPDYSAEKPFAGGPSAVSRLERDVIDLPGVAAVIWMEGINDFGAADAAVEMVEDGYAKGVARLRERLPGVTIVAATLTSALHSTIATHGRVEVDAKRKALNEFLRTAKIFDGVVDFDAVTFDASTGEIKPAMQPNSSTGGPGDKLHPNRAGYAAMGNAIPLEMITARSAEPLHVDGGALADVTPDEKGIRVFKGIPYAAPPVGSLRWKPPQAVPAWSGVRSGTEWGPRCMQSNRLGDIDPLNKRMDEDCLYLNVWTPAKSAADKLAVMVWIHGGSNLNGAGSQPEYDGARLAAKGVVVVTINYRLDIFGFLATPELTQESDTHASGNYALLDQIAALKWVQNNIAAFGGDPSRVTVFGESAGSLDISLLMASPLTKGLFARAIGESGGALTPIVAFGPKPLKVGERDGADFVASLGAPSLADLRARPAAELLGAILKKPIIYGFGVVDGYAVPEHPALAFAKGKQNDVPLLVGWNADEGTLFAARVTFPPNAPSYADRLRTQFKDQADQVLKLYPPGSTPDEDKAAFAVLFGDEIIGYGGWAWADRAAATGKAPVYRYYFTRRPPGAPQSSISPLTAPGVYHSAELYYVFETLGVRDWPWEADDRHLADVMSSYWVNFAKTGDPNGPGLPQWSPYKPNGGGQVMELGKEIGMRGELHRDRYEFFDALYGKLSSQ